MIEDSFSDFEADIDDGAAGEGEPMIEDSASDIVADIDDGAAGEGEDIYEMDVDAQQVEDNHQHQEQVVE
jgi:hypothetical protein